MELSGHSTVSFDTATLALALLVFILITTTFYVHAILDPLYVCS